MRTQLVEKRQRYQILGDQLAASQKAISAHSVNQPEFDTRKTEHKELSSSIAGLRQVYSRDGMTSVISIRSDSIGRVIAFLYRNSSPVEQHAQCPPLALLFWLPNDSISFYISGRYYRSYISFFSSRRGAICLTVFLAQSGYTLVYFTPT